MYGLIVCTALTGPKSCYHGQSQEVSSNPDINPKAMEPALSVLTPCLSWESQRPVSGPYGFAGSGFSYTQIPGGCPCVPGFPPSPIVCAAGIHLTFTPLASMCKDENAAPVLKVIL